MPILIDGNNLLHSLPREQAHRGDVRRLVLDACRRERMSVTVVFDGPPPTGTPSHELLGAVTIVYSGSATADDVILRHLATGASAREWVVVTDDRGLARRVRQQGAEVRSIAEWQRPRRARPRRPEWQPKLSSHEVAEWEEFFSGARQDED
jgi:predicted RNA-binding protein with PIN domain